MRDESYWQSEGWRTLCNQVINLCLRHSDSLCDAVDAGSEDLNGHIQQFVDRILRALSQRINCDLSGLWQTALSLFGDTPTLLERLQSDPILIARYKREPFKDEVTLDQALRQSLRDYLNDMKRQNLPHRANLWPRINRISQKICAAELTSHRCTPEHMLAVCKHIRTHYPDDHNLPRTYDTTEAYFLEFCVDCQERFIDYESITPDDLDLFSDIEIDLLPMLEHCLEMLKQENKSLYETLNAVFRLGNVTPISKSAYLKTQGLSRRQMERQQQQGLALLRDCLQTQLMEGASKWTSIPTV